MPFKNKADKLAYQRKFYAANSKKVIAAVNRRKWELYGGICENCGGPTMGNTKGAAARFCSKPECRSAFWRARRQGLA